MFKTIYRMINWCGKWKGRLFIGFIFAFFSQWFAAMPIMLGAYMVGKLVEDARGISQFNEQWIGGSALLIIAMILLRFVFEYLQARFQESISYELVARDRLEIGEALKRVSLGYFQSKNTGNILNSITTGLHALENMGMRMINSFVGGYLSFLCIFLCIFLCKPSVACISLLGIFVSCIFMICISRFSTKNAPVEAEATRDMTSAVLEYARGLQVVKSFGQKGASMEAMSKACADSRRIHLKIEWGFIPANCAHLLALKIAGIAMCGATFHLALAGEMTLPIALMLAFFSLNIFASIEPISDSAHVLGVINDAMNQLDMLKENQCIDKDGKELTLKHHDIVFDQVAFSYDSRPIIKDISFTIPEKTTTAIVGPSGSGKTTLCNLLARFYDVDGGKIMIDHTDIRKLTCDALMKNISMVFQDVYLFNDTVRNNICFGKQDATEEDMIEAAKKACCHDFIMNLPNGYDTVIGEGGGTLSGGEKQRISIARAILKDAPIVILDEATASIDPENEHLIQSAISKLTHGKTIIIIAHRLATIENADQILVLDQGNIVECGTHKELAQKEGLYKHFLEVRRKAEQWECIV